MNAIMGFSDMLADERLSEEQADYVRAIRDSGRHLLRLIDDILDFSRIEAGKLEIEIIDCCLSEILGSIRSLAEFKATEKDLDFEIGLSKELPARIRTDPTRLSQCLINLVNNAIKFTDHGHVHMNVSSKNRDGLVKPCCQADLPVLLLVPVCHREVHSFIIYTNISQRHVVVKGARVSLLEALGYN